jgi:hypothetical protein
MTVVAVVEADHEELAGDVARQEKRDILTEGEFDITVISEIKTADDLPSDWDVLCYPYGGDGNKSIRGLLGR